MKKAKQSIKKSFSLRRPVSSLAKRAVRALAPVEQAAKDMSKMVLRLLTATKPNKEKFSLRPLVKKGLTIDQLLRKARPQQVEYSLHVVIKNVKKVWHKRSLNPVIVCETYSKKTGKDAKGYDRYVTYVEALPTKLGDRFSETRVKVGCSCPFFTFYSEYALAKHGAADIQFSNGEPPVDRNPKERPFACKHVIKLLYKIDEKGL